MFKNQCNFVLQDETLSHLNVPTRSLHANPEYNQQVCVLPLATRHNIGNEWFVRNGT